MDPRFRSLTKPMTTNEGDFGQARVTGPGGDELKQAIEASGAVLHGHFRLASGRHSDVYIEKFRVLERPQVLVNVSGAIAAHFRDSGAQAVAGPSTGGMIVAYEVARQMGLPAIYVEEEGGKRVLKRGGRIEPGSRVLLVDDVLTTGISLMEVLAVIREARATPVGVGVLIDRSGKEIDLGAELFAATRFEARTYAEDEVPDWLAKIPVAIPGTRAKLLAT